MPTSGMLTNLSAAPARGSKNDPVVRDGKRLAYAGGALRLLPKFLLHVCVILPVLICCLIPLAFCFFVFNAVFGSKPKPAVAAPTASVVQTPLKVAPLAQRKFDLILFGATGFTGGLAAKYLATQYGDSNITWAIAGRRIDALEKVRAECAAINPKCADIPVFIVDALDADTLIPVVRQARAVVTTMGPFARYGNVLVEVCARYGTSYADITGETVWVRTTIDRFDDAARKSGAHIVSFCGHDCVPWDLAVHMVADKLAEAKEELVRVDCFDEIRGEPSGGTLETIYHSLENSGKVKSSLGFDPLLKSTEGKQSKYGLKAANQAFVGYSSIYKSFVGPFVMASVMSNCVRRSNAVNEYGPHVVYNEAAVYPSFMAGAVSFIQLLVFGVSLALPPLSWALRKFVLLKPGQGPSEASMDKGFLKLTAVGTGSKKSKATATVYFPTDPGYRDTARMLVESGLCLALNKDEISVSGGVYTPAAVMSAPLLRRLQKTGSEFYIE